MVTTLLQLHHDVQEARRAAFTFTQSLVVPGEDPSDHKHKTHTLISKLLWTLGRKRLAVT